MTRSKILLLPVLSFFSLAVFGQVGVVYDLKKPAKFENRTLASEKSTERKFGKPRHFLQNTVTHYNFYFNANNKLNEVLAKAKALTRDDYTRLLPFYNYTLDATLSQKRDLDSVIYKCTAGILLHDTRNDWIDNLYLLIGKAYFLKKDFDSAYITFQFLNFAFAPKEKDGYDKVIASNMYADEGGSNYIVSSKEKRNIAQKIFSLPPSRNESLVWQIRTYLAKDKFPDAAALITILRHDPQFPLRLAPDLEEMQALYFYKQSSWDSAAWHLERALPGASTKEEMARWEYLIAQLYERAENSSESKNFYERTVRHTFDPILEVYARLNSIRQNKNKEEDYIQKNIDALVKMGHKDRYEPYRDIIWYTAAQIELERDNKPGAKAFLLLCTRTGPVGDGGQSSYKNKAFLQLGNISFAEKNYPVAKNYYDSVRAGDNSLGDIAWLPDRKAALASIVIQLRILARQDSLQRIAAMPPADRDAYIKKLVKTLRRQKGLRDDDQQDPSDPAFSFNNNKGAAPDLFSSGQGSTDWYFNNPSLKSKGYSDFKTKWGNRPNVDNWQLSSSASQRVARPGERLAPGSLDLNNKEAASAKPVEISYKALLANLPLTPEAQKKSSDSVEKAMFALGKAYQEGLPDYASAISIYDSLLQRTQDITVIEPTLFNVYYCYKKMGDEANADRILKLMKQKYPDGQFTAKAIDPYAADRVSSKRKAEATTQYEKIYNSFIEGRFDEAMDEKRVADSIYGDKYWTPQLLYIESVYLIRSRRDGQAKMILGNIVQKYPKDPMAGKAAALIDVLGRRQQIENYLTNLKIERAKDDDTVVTAPSPLVQGKPVLPDSAKMAQRDSLRLALAKYHPQVIGQKPPSVGAPGQKLQVDTGNLTRIKMDAGELARLRKQADSLESAMKKAFADSVALVRSGKKADSLKMATLQHRSDSLRAVLQKLQADTAQLVGNIRALNSAFAYGPEKPHSIMIVMDKVDPVYVSEAKNAFNRYNLENYYSLGLTIDNSSLSDSLKLVVIGSFENSAAALDYLTKTRAMAPRAIVPWLPANKYSFLIISGPNLDLLKTNKDMPAYKKFLQAAFPGKF
ncbi:MAG TPA: hypothetical protein VK563_09960 [Puia sp.]|nr:hypothetical protein [Puia sp.]